MTDERRTDKPVEKTPDDLADDLGADGHGDAEVADEETLDDPTSVETGTEADSVTGTETDSVRPARDRGRRAPRKVWPAVGATVMSLALLAVAGAAAVLGTEELGLDQRALDVPAGTPVTLAAQSDLLVCAAPVSLPDGGSDDTTDAFGSTPVETENLLQVAAFGAATTTTVDALAPITSASDPASSGTDQSSTSPSDPASVDAAAAGQDPVVVSGTDPSTVLSAPAGDSGHALRTVVSGGVGSATGSAAFLTAAGDLRGVAAAACQQPGTEHWLVGGGTELGSSSRLVLQNPSRTPATVTVTVWGPTGELTLAGPSTYLVPPGAQVSTLLEGLAAEQRGLVVRVSATGALVTSYLQNNVLDGFTPAGVDLVVAGTGPAAGQVLTGLVVPEAAVTDQDVATLRLLAPEQDGDAAITVLGADGQRVLRGAQTVGLTAGDVTDVNLAGLPAGTYTVLVQSEVPVAAGAMVTAQGKADSSAQGAGGTPKDRAWIASSHGQEGQARAAAVPEGLAATLVVTPLPGELGAVGEIASQVPIVYSEASADAAVPADDAGGEGADPATVWQSSVHGTVEVYGTDGRLLGSQDLDLALGQTTSVDLRTIRDAVSADSTSAVGAVRVVPAAGDALVLDWAVVVSDPDVSGSISVLGSTAPALGSDTVTVLRSPRVGLGQG